MRGQNKVFLTQSKGFYSDGFESYTYNRGGQRKVPSKNFTQGSPKTCITKLCPPVIPCYDSNAYVFANSIKTQLIKKNTILSQIN